MTQPNIDMRYYQELKFYRNKYFAIFDSYSKW